MGKANQKYPKLVVCAILQKRSDNLSIFPPYLGGDGNELFIDCELGVIICLLMHSLSEAVLRNLGSSSFVTMCWPLLLLATTSTGTTC